MMSIEGIPAALRGLLAEAARSLTYNFGPGWEPLLWKAYGLQTMDSAKIEFYKMLDEFF